MMPEPTQLTIDGRETAVQAPEPPRAHGPAAPLFNAPQTIRGQLAMPAAVDCPSCSHPARVGPHAAGYCGACFLSFRADGPVGMTS